MKGALRAGSSVQGYTLTDRCVPSRDVVGTASESADRPSSSAFEISNSCTCFFNGANHEDDSGRTCDDNDGSGLRRCHRSGTGNIRKAPSLCSAHAGSTQRLSEASRRADYEGLERWPWGAIQSVIAQSRAWPANVRLALLFALELVGSAAAQRVCDPDHWTAVAIPSGVVRTCPARNQGGARTANRCRPQDTQTSPK